MADGIDAGGRLPAPPELVFEYLSRLENPWRRADRWIEVLSVEAEPEAPPGAPADRGRVRIRGPLGLRRTARTQVLAAKAPDAMQGSAEIGRRTRARVRWTLAGAGAETDVRLAAEVETAGPLDRLLLELGGRAWLRRRFRSVLDNLAELFAAGDETGSEQREVEAEEVGER
jgi:hypothetical protein